MTSSLPHRRRERGQNIIGVIVMTVILLIISIGVLSTLGGSFGATRNVEPQSIGETTAANVQTDLSSMAMYDPAAANTLKHIAAGTKITVTPPTPVASGYYPPADTQPTTVTIQKVTPTTNGAALNIQTTIPSTGTVPVSQQSTISVSQGAPPTCDSSLPAGTVPGC
jgi:type II secretory pathway pseudopilin PulG